MTAIYGRHTYGKLEIRAWQEEYKTSTLRVGAFCSLADKITVFLDGNHSYSSFSTFPFKESLGWDAPPNSCGKSIPEIGSDVWIGSDVTIFSGVTIGHGAVIGAKTVVTKDVPPYAIFAGNPGRIKKYRFSQDIIDDLLKYPWWELPDHIIRTEIIPTTDDIHKTIEKLKEIYALYAPSQHS
jgi:acetyltransferase-like isoleucine patch superfamily enzyme